MTLTIICQECRRKPATTNAQLSPGVLMALCEECVKKIDKAMSAESVAYRGAERTSGD